MRTMQEIMDDMVTASAIYGDLIEAVSKYDTLHPSQGNQGSIDRLKKLQDICENTVNQYSTLQSTTDVGLDNKLTSSIERALNSPGSHGAKDMKSTMDSIAGSTTT